MTAIYNDTDRHAAEWLRELIAHGHIMEGTVDERSIADIRAADLAGFTRVHFFAGIGGWDYALRLAGWPADRPVWTGSCPCQPFSSAGRRGAEGDERHLWPEFYRLIAECRPPVVFGEQVASKAGRAWLAGVRADLESLGYSVGAADLCAAGVGAPHIRQRLYWVAESRGGRVRDSGCGAVEGEARGCQSQARERQWVRPDAAPVRDAECAGGTGGVELAASERLQWGEQAGAATGAVERDAMPWPAYDLIPCRDGKSRRVESGSFPLVAGLPRGVVPSGDPSVAEVQATAEARTMRLRGYGNAIVPQVAAEFVRAYMEASGVTRV